MAGLHGRGGGSVRQMSVPGAISPAGAKFSFWSSMGDLVRLVMRSRAKGLRTRLAVALALVLVGKWTGVIAPLAVQKLIDGLSRHVPYSADLV